MYLFFLFISYYKNYLRFHRCLWKSDKLCRTIKGLKTYYFSCEIPCQLLRELVYFFHNFLYFCCNFWKHRNLFKKLQILSGTIKGLWLQYLYGNNGLLAGFQVKFQVIFTFFPFFNFLSLFYLSISIISYVY